jgi:hypothetical protein
MKFSISTVWTLAGSCAVYALLWIDVTVDAFTPAVRLPLHTTGHAAPWLAPAAAQCRQPSTVCLSAMTNDDDDEDEEEEDDDTAEPLSKGIDSVSWLPTVVGAKSSDKGVQLTQRDSEILPLFPLGGIVYTPNSQRKSYLTMFGV